MHTNRPALRLTFLAALAALLLTAGVPALAHAQSAAPVAPRTLTAAQENGLLYMVEEEKLAEDLYRALGATWSLPIFTRIAGAEAQHQAAIARMLALYGIDNPAANLPAGEFRNQELQALYDSLAAQGAGSLEAALTVGVLVEETDIADLDAALQAGLPADVARVFSRLRTASGNHLRAFTSLLAADDSAAIGTASAPGRGRGRR